MKRAFPSATTPAEALTARTVSRLRPDGSTVGPGRGRAAPRAPRRVGGAFRSGGTGTACGSRCSSPGPRRRGSFLERDAPAPLDDAPAARGPCRRPRAPRTYVCRSEGSPNVRLPDSARIRRDLQPRIVPRPPAGRGPRDSVRRPWRAAGLRRTSAGAVSYLLPAGPARESARRVTRRTARGASEGRRTDPRRGGGRGNREREGDRRPRPASRRTARPGRTPRGGGRARKAQERSPAARRLAPAPRATRRSDAARRAAPETAREHRRTPPEPDRDRRVARRAVRLDVFQVAEEDKDGVRSEHASRRGGEERVASARAGTARRTGRPSPAEPP